MKNRLQNSFDSCTLCGGRLKALKYWHVEQDLSGCVNCGAIFNQKRHNIKGEHVSSYDLAFFDQMGRHPLMFATDCSRLLKFMGLKNLAGRKIVDIGCGAGFFLDFVSEQGATAIGVELNKTVHDSIRKRGHKIYSNINEMALDHSGTVDIAYLSHTLEHIIDPGNALSSVYSIMKAGGAISVTVPCLNSMTFLFERILLSLNPNSFWRIFSENHLTYFNHRSLKSVIEQAGFKDPRIFPGAIGENLIRGILKSERSTRFAYRYLLQPALSLTSLVNFTPNICIIARKP
jgi:SAM-dependent methyltransferase